MNRGFTRNGWAIWLTGMPGSGKSTLARLVARRLWRLRVRVQVLSVEMLRKVLTPRPQYTEKEREIVYGTLVLVAKMLTRNGVNVLIDATANRRAYRDAARQNIPHFCEVYLKCPLEVCVKRERKRKRRFGAPSRIYDKAKTGASKTVPGIGVPYEIPLRPELEVNTSMLKPNQAAQMIVRFISDKWHHRRG